MSQNQALATVQSGKALQQQAKQAPSFMEVQNMASVFYASGMFTDIKSEAQASVKILAGQVFGFDPITSMAYVHIIQGKAYLGAKIQAGLIKSSGIYDYKITEHTDKACCLQFYKYYNGEWKPLNIPIRYTIEEATQAGVTSNPTWKKHPKAMLFASCIRQGMTRCTPDLLRSGSAVTPSYAQISHAAETVGELAEVSSEAEFSDVTIDAEIETSGTRADLETQAFELISNITGNDDKEISKLLKGQSVADMSDDVLAANIELWKSI